MIGEAIAVASALGGFYNDWQNRKINKENLELQKDTQEWNKEAQQTTWAREDNAVQRRAAGLKAAGLSQTLAAGGAASSSGPIRLESPHRDQDSYTSGLDKASVAMAMLRQKADISRTEAENDYIQLQKQGQNIKNQIDQHDLDIYKKTGVASNFSGTPLGQVGLGIWGKIKDVIKERNERPIPKSKAPWSIEDSKKFRQKK